MKPGKPFKIKGFLRLSHPSCNILVMTSIEEKPKVLAHGLS